MDKYNVKGEMIFIYSQDEGLIVKTRDYKEDWEKFFVDKTIYSLMSGKEFVSLVDSGCIIDDDGSLSNIFIDGYNSNLGLHHKGLTDGSFLVDKDTFLDICKHHKVEVNWANK